MSTFRAFTIFVLLAVLPVAGNTTIITLDFNDAEPSGGSTTPYLEDGFRISVMACHYDIRPKLDPSTWQPTEDQYIGTDGSGCDQADQIPVSSSYPRATLRLDRFGETFNLLSLDLNVEAQGMVFRSSNGGLLSWPDMNYIPGEEWLPQTFSGTEWRDIQWMELVASIHAGAPIQGGVDNIRLRIPEPSTFALFGLGLLGLGFARRRA